MQLPLCQNLDVTPLTRIFSNTSAAYKFFWFLSLLEIIQKDRKTEIPYSEIVARMFAKAWYRLFFKLSFGKTESLAKWIDELQIIQKLSFDAKEETIIESLLLAQQNSQIIKAAFKQVADEVPYRFLMPWVKEDSNSRMLLRSQTFENNCLYSLKRDRIYGLLISINPEWISYLRTNYQILTEFTYWNLAQYLQAKNPNVPAITAKLTPLNKRKPLNKQNNFWKKAIQIQGRIRCIYTGLEITPKMAIDLDHFMPLRFVAHNRIWNLIPIARNRNGVRLNSCKSDFLPDIERFLPAMANEHLHAIQAYLRHGEKHELLEDYSDLGLEIEDFYTISQENFFEAFSKTYTPMSLIAKNMGFEIWNF